MHVIDHCVKLCFVAGMSNYFSVKGVLDFDIIKKCKKQKKKTPIKLPLLNYGPLKLVICIALNKAFN